MFGSLETALYPVVIKINEYLSNYILVFLLIAVGLWYTVRTRFVQVRCFGEGMRKVFGDLTLNGKKHESGMSSFQALATAVAAQVGTGNIVGSSGAILTGGPGAIFWMWVIAFFGMATIYAEATLAQKTRVVDEDGTIHGGPVYYITTAFRGGFGKFLAAFFAVAIILALGFMGCMVQSNSIGTIHGGPVYYITTAFRGGFGKFLAAFFAVAIILALGFMGCMVQSNSIGSTFETAFGVPSWIVGVVLVVICAVIFLGGVQRLAAVTEKVVPVMAVISTFETAFGVPSWIVGVVLVVICAVIFLGGVQRLAAVTEKVVPVMAVIFLLGAVVVLVFRAPYLPETVGMIFKYAFQPQAIIGGGFGYALKTAISQGAKAVVVLVFRAPYLPETVGMIFKYAFQPQAIIGGGFGYALKTAISQGAKRGLFSNEAGMGSTPHAHAQANVKDPHDQGVVAMVGVFIDTFVVLTLNALVIISTLYTAGGPLAECGAAAASTVLNKANLAQTAFGVVFGERFGAIFVAVCLFFFAFSTVLSWNLFGKINVIYLFGKKSAKIYSAIGLVFIFLGTVMSNDLVWELTDMFNNLMVIPNAIALFALTGVVVKVAEHASAARK